MPDVPTSAAPPVPPEVTLAESAGAALADLTDLARRLPAGDPAANAAIFDRLSEELAECAAMARALPGRPVTLAGYDWQLLSGMRTSHRSGEDVAEALAHGLARLAAALGSSAAVTASRPSSWEATHVRALLAGEVGEDDQYLHLYRTTS